MTCLGRTEEPPGVSHSQFLCPEHFSPGWEEAPSSRELELSDIETEALGRPCVWGQEKMLEEEGRGQIERAEERAV